MPTYFAGPKSGCVDDPLPSTARHSFTLLFGLREHFHIERALPNTSYLSKNSSFIYSGRLFFPLVTIVSLVFPSQLSPATSDVCLEITSGRVSVRYKSRVSSKFPSLHDSTSSFLLLATTEYSIFLRTNIIHLSTKGPLFLPRTRCKPLKIVILFKILYGAYHAPKSKYVTLFFDVAVAYLVFSSSCSHRNSPGHKRAASIRG